MNAAGSCLCGKVNIVIPEIAEEITVCHCHMCQKFFGGPFLSLPGISSEAFVMQGETKIRRFMSSEWAERGSCKVCGSSLFYHSLADDTYYFPAGLYDALDHAMLKEEIFYDQKPTFFHYQESTEKLTEAAFMERLFDDLE